MGFEDDYNPSGTVTKVARNLVGGPDSPSPRVIVSRGRGWGVGSTIPTPTQGAPLCKCVPWVETKASGFTPPPDPLPASGEGEEPTHGYPLYDGHGNCRGILTKNGTSYGTGNWRTYDVWGSVRSGSATGDPKSRYVASIGHVADDESSLIYMRARYYEPATGRFISEDPAIDGKNWYVYCENQPITQNDPSGRNSEYATAWWVLGSAAAIAFCSAVIGTNNFALWASTGAFAVGIYGCALAHTGVSRKLTGAFFSPFSEWVYTALIAAYISSLALSLKSASRTKISAVGMKCIFVMVAYSLSILAAIAWTWEDPDANTP